MIFIAYKLKFGGQIRQRPLALPLGELSAVRLTERVPQRRKYHLNMLRVALSGEPLSGQPAPP